VFVFVRPKKNKCVVAVSREEEQCTDD
jgi:hypothetical protein